MGRQLPEAIRGLYAEDMSFSAEYPMRMYVRVTPKHGREVKPHFHPSVEIVHFENDSGSVTIDGERYRFGPNKLIIIRPYAIHSYRIERDRERHLILRIDPAVLSDIVRGSVLERLARPFITRFYSFVPLQTVDTAFLRALRSLSANDAISRIGALFALEPFFAALATSGVAAPVFDYVRTMNYLEAHYAEKVTLAMIAEHLNESVSQLSRRFTHAYPAGFADFLGRIRIGKAKVMIAHTDAALGDIAFAVGFSDVAQFTKTFRKFTGLSPREYRKRIAAEA
ncbi:MAG: AraC family transcriptional regulator [Spirochaetota bacterium]